MKNLITIVIATNNAEKHIKKTLLSLKKQNNNGFEIIVIDNNSSDRTVDIIKNYFDNSLIDSTGDKGIADAWNKSLKIIKNSWILFLNAGDELHYNWIKEMSSIIRNIDTLSWITSDVSLINNKSIEKVIVACNPSKIKLAFANVGFAHPGSLVHTDLFAKLGPFNTSKKIAMDSCLIYDAHRLGVNFFHSRSIVYMDRGGISDKNFMKGINEFYSYAYKDKKLYKYLSYIISFILATTRVLVNYCKVRLILRNFKHISIRVLNFIINYFPFSVIRNQIFKLSGFKIGNSSCICKGTQISAFNGNLNIGKGTVINTQCYIDTRGYIKIGNSVSISRNCSLITAGHDINSQYFDYQRKNITIEDHAVLFSNVLVMPGVIISKGTVVLPGAVVTKNTESFTVYGGVPARKISNRNTDCKYILNYNFPNAL